jgi:hypothetical protein
MRLITLFTAALFFSNKLCTQTYHYYFGNLHAHTAFSDGNKDSVSSGIARPDASYSYAKLSNDFDFLGISEHNHYSANHNPGFKQPRYQVGLNMADAANEEGNFLALFGMEYGVSSQYNGHVIVYGFNQLIGWENSAPGITGNNYDIFNSKSDYDGLFKKVKNNPTTFCYLAHPSFDDFTGVGTYATALANAPYNAAYDSAIVGMPLRSGLATSTLSSYDDYSQGHYFNYYKKMLYQGYHLGIGYDHDNHYSNFGRSNGGRLVVLAPSLTRASLYAAMKQMHFYGSDDSNAKIEFRMNGNIMGSIISGSVYPTFSVIHNDPDGEQADSIKIWRGNRNSGGLWAEIVYLGTKNNTLTFTDEKIVSNIEYYYFAEIRQEDGQWIMTSPIWYTGYGSVLVKEEKQSIVFDCFPNPVSKSLSLSFSQAGNYDTRILDVSGRMVLETIVNEKETVVDFSGVVPGIYFLEIKSKSTHAFKKLVVE